ncbi:MAG: 3'-5' exonuclease [Ilumatobacter sp.]|uniref:3'-5' exonuclease n=1 Tax=Ilumatobacter sp. TaxID=1967498 RepID=UPI00262906D0|nr:3'-5' exonuclease [Ilumatobacter sp.]MDJ0770018.1 3'-5' exonuclease [Ilumatobacter sp.]
MQTSDASLDTAAGTGGVPRFAVVDIETSGLSTRWHKVLQIAVVTVEGGTVVDEWTSLVKLRWPLQRVGPSRVHGITRTTLRHAPSQREVLTELARRLEGAVFTAHNVRFDWPFLSKAARRSHVDLGGTRRLCTLRLSRGLDPDRELSHRLADVCDRYGVSNDRPHDALHDARATAEILPHLLAAHGVESAADLEPLYERR